MRSSTLLSLAGLAIAPYLVVADDGPAVRVAKSFIVEYAPASGKVRRQSITSTDGITVVKEFDSPVFHGASIETETLNEDDLVQLPQILAVWPNEEIELLPTFDAKAAELASANEYTTHNVTGVNKLHEQGIFGKGVKIGVVDTGIWYRHPALGGGFGEGFKVTGGRDLVGNGNWPASGPRTPDNDPLDQQGHGTHVAGIIGGSIDGWTGVAPEATLYGYKVFSQAGNTNTEVLIESFLSAYEDGMDIITASIGGANGFGNNAWAVVASRLVLEGVVVTISAGNSGANGPFYGSSGSSGENVIAVASVETPILPAYPFEATVAGEDKTFGYLPATDYFPPTVADWPVVSLSLDPAAPADACTPFPAGTRSLVGTVPLVRRGTCTFQVKQENLARLGAKYILIYNDAREIVTPSTANFDTLIAMVSAATGEEFIAALKAGQNVTVDFSANPEKPIGLDHPSGNRPNAFTSWATLYDLGMKPDIAAPGGNIFSTWVNNGYNIISGTSMACPYVAGVAALYISAHGGRYVQGKGFAYELSRRIISSGRALPWSDGTATNYGYTASPAQVGNGMIDAWKVLKYKTELNFKNMALNDTNYFSRYHDITVKNEGTEAVSYKLSQEPAAGLDTLITASGVTRVRTFTELVPKEYTNSVSLPRDFTLQPGESKTVSVNFQPPGSLGWDASALPLYGGSVVVAGSNGERLSFPYLGLGGDLRRQLGSAIWSGYPFSVSTRANTPFAQKSTYSMDLSVAAQDFPKIVSKLLWGTTQIRFDIFEAGTSERAWTYPPVPGKDGYIGPAASWVGSGNPNIPIFNPAQYNFDETFTYPETNVPRSILTSTDEHWWFGKLGNGSYVVPGTYTVRFAVLRPFGNPRHADNWSVYRPTSGLPQFTVTGRPLR